MNRIISLVALLLLIGCRANQPITTAVPTTALIEAEFPPTAVAQSTPMPLPTDTPVPTLAPTDTAVPTLAPTPTPSATATPTPTVTPDPTVRIVLDGRPSYTPRTLIATDLVEAVSYSVVPAGCVVVGAVNATDSNMYPHVAFDAASLEEGASGVSLSFVVAVDEPISIISATLQLQVFSFLTLPWPGRGAVRDPTFNVRQHIYSIRLRIHS